MLFLTAHSHDETHSERWALPPTHACTLGRGTDNDCSVPWDARVSRKHAELIVNGEELIVRCLPGARNPICRGDESTAETRVSPGSNFRIGRTTFQLTSERRVLPALGPLDNTGAPESETTDMFVRTSDIRLTSISRRAPALWMTEDSESLAKNALEILHDVLVYADLLVIFQCNDVEAARRPEIVYWKKSESGIRAFVSRTLIARALEEDETAIQVDTDADGSPAETGRWSYCVPVRSEAPDQWYIYVGGPFGPNEGFPARLRPTQLKADASLAELISHLIGAIRHVRSLESQVDGISQFFSPKLLESISFTGSGSNMSPRETDVVVIYCDLRGFSRIVEESTHDLHTVLRRISTALGVMTESIIGCDGVIADFQGDSALGFWGWPLALADGPLSACRAALRIRKVFKAAAAGADEDLKGFHVGIGIASGRAIAGRIGTRDQAKIGVFGPVVNLASRLEGITKKVGVSILMDEASAHIARNQLKESEGRCRKIGTLQPAGFESPVTVSELLPPTHESEISERDIVNFERAVDAFEAGDWEDCRNLLGLLPPRDRARDFLLVQIASNNYLPPVNWSGVISLNSK